MSKFKVQHLFEEGMAFNAHLEPFPSMSSAFRYLEREIEDGRGSIISVYVKGDVMTLFANMGDEDIAFQVVPLPECPL